MLKPPSTVTTNLIKARELIADEKYWCQGRRFMPNGRMCALGALERTTGGGPWGEEGVLLAGAFAELFGFDRAIELSLQEG